ncbi:MAG: Hpt domain-containing protein [Nitrospiraceae bacterium]
MSDESIRDNLIDVFVEEGQEGLQILSAALAPELGLPSQDDLYEHYRVGHKLKGAAALYQFMGISAIGSLFEEVLEHAKATPAVIWPDVVRWLRELTETLRTQLQALASAKTELPFDADHWRNRYQAILSKPIDLSNSSDTAPVAATSDAAQVPAAPSGAHEHTELIPDHAFVTSDVVLPPIDAEVLEYFVPEIEELLTTSSGHIEALTNALDDHDRIHRLFRDIHTMKGSAYTVGYQIIGDIALPLEDRLRDLRDRRAAMPSGILDLTRQTLAIVTRVIARKSDDVPALQRDIPTLLGTIASWSETPAVVEAVEASPNVQQTETEAHTSSTVEPVSVDAPAIASDMQAQMEPVSAPEPVRLETPVAAPHAPTPVASTQPAAVVPASSGTIAPDGTELTDAYLLPDLDAEVLSYFVPEAQEYLELLEAYLLKLEKDPQSTELINHLFRTAHTLKGSAFTVGFTPIGDLIHYVEDLMGAIREKRAVYVAGMADVILKSVDLVRLLMRRDPSMIAQVRGRFRTVVADLKRLADGSAVGVLASAAIPDPAMTPHQQQAHAGTEEPAKVSAAQDDAAAAQAGDVIRVNRERLEKLLNLVGELVIGRGRLEQRLVALEYLANQVQSFKGKMLETVRGFEEKHSFTLPSQPSHSHQAPVPSDGMPAQAIPGLGDFGALEFDKYDDFNILARRISEVTADITESMVQLSGSIRSAREDMSQLHHLTLGMRDEIARARMVSIGTPFTRFRRAVREMARATGKEVTLVTTGEQTEVDTSIVERLVDPLVHLVRNAVYHGIEPTAVRIAQCKPAVGTVYLHAAHRGNAVIIEIEDDGAGIEPEKLKNKALSKGLITQGTAKTMTDAEAMKLIFLPGFSTAEVIGDQAGRGVGLDVVKKTIEGMNGFIDVETAKGIGTKFTLNLPLTLLIATALLVRAGNWRYAIPLSSVREVLIPAPGVVQQIAGQLVLQLGDTAVPVDTLSHALTGVSSEIAEGAPVVIVRTGQGLLGLAVDELFGRQEIVVKPLGALKILERSFFSGATIDPEGRVVLVVDVGRINGQEQSHSGGIGGLTVEADAAGPRAETPSGGVATAPGGSTILLIDDSLSIRKFVARMLESAGYVVETAVDGEEGVRKASANPYRMIITDLEMPKLNGYEVIQALRARPQTQTTPIVVMTTRAGDKHKQLAMNVGASGYIAKPVEERALVAEVERWVGAATARKK